MAILARLVDLCRRRSARVHVTLDRAPTRLPDLTRRQVELIREHDRARRTLRGAR